MPVLTRIRALLRGTFCSSWKQGCFWVKLEKYLIGRKPRACGTNWYMIYEKIRQFLTKIDSKRFSSRYFQGRSLHSISFFPSDKLFPIFSNVKRIICAIKKIDHCARTGTKDPGTCCFEKRLILCFQNARTYSPKNVMFWPLQHWGVTLTKAFLSKLTLVETEVQ